MSSNIAIKVNDVCKHYPIYKTPQDRLKQFFRSGLYKLFGIKVKRYYQEFHALENISFEVKKGETVGIIGRNGSGKSTLLQIICGILNPSSGTVIANGRIAALLELGSGFNPEFTGRENIYLNASILGLNENQIDDVYQDIVNFADIGDFIGQPIKTYSSGMVVRLAFAVIAHVSADILIIDEALAVGDAVFTQKCMRFLRRFMENNTVLFVSHDTGSVSSLCRNAIWLDQGHLREYGETKQVIQNYTEFCTHKIYGESVTFKSIKNEKYKSDSDIVPAIDLNTKIGFFDNLANADGWYSGAAEIKSVSFESQSGSSIFFGGDCVTLRIEAIAHKSLSSPIIGFFLRDKLGQALFGENTYLHSNLINISPGENVVAEFEFNLPYLPNGEYSLTVAIADGTQQDHTQHHWLHDALIIRVQSSVNHHGLVGIPFRSVSLKNY
jgi:lipopolysaccharide transport system ATP-binding protein